MTTANTAMTAEITRADVSAERPFGPTPRRSTSSAVAVWPTTAPTANIATPTIATAKLAQAINTPPRTPAGTAHQTRVPSRTVAGIRAIATRISRDATAMTLRINRPMMNENNAEFTPLPECWVNSPFDLDWSADATPANTKIDASPAGPAR